MKDMGKVNFSQKRRAPQLIRSGDNCATLAIIGFPATRWDFILVVSYESQGVALAIAQKGQDTVNSSADCLRRVDKETPTAQREPAAWFGCFFPTSDLPSLIRPALQSGLDSQGKES